MRLFIAIPFDAQTIDALADVQRACRGAGITGNYTRRENLHLTIAFLGEVRDPRPVAAVLQSVLLPALTLSFRKSSLFRDILVAELARNAALEQYAKELRHALDSAGIDYDRKPFRPHVTLIRRSDIPDAADLPSLFSQLCSVPVSCTRAQLMRTNFIDGRATYSCLAVQESE